MTTNSDETNVANNVAQLEMQDLTEQWKKGELEGEYYIETTNGEIYNVEFQNSISVKKKKLLKVKSFKGYVHKKTVKEVLASVPSYEEWQELQEYKRIVTSYNMKPIDYDIACETVNKLLDEKQQLKRELGALKESCKLIASSCHTLFIIEQNQQLKELLKECREFFVGYETFARNHGCTNVATEAQQWISKIDNAIGEKK